MKILSKMMKNEDGATAIEYGLIAALIAVALITILGQLGGTLKGTFGKIDSKLAVTNSSIT
jgi:pilus assembly protein Flp/PilA